MRPFMHKSSTTKGMFSAALLAGIFAACSSDDDSSTVSGRPSQGGSKAGSSSGGSAGKPSVLPSGGNGSGATSGSSGVIPTDACPGLPIELPEAEPSGGGGESGLGLGGATGQAGEQQGGADSLPAGEAGSPGAGGADADATCSGVSVEAEAVPVDLFIMMDRSTSMSTLVDGTNTTRWEALSAAVQDFVDDPAAADIRMGIGFFSLSGVADDNTDCNADDYADPTVPIGLVSDVGADLVSAIDEITPAGLTPTVPALQGAISYAEGWAAEHPERATQVVLVTDGYPTQCVTSPEAIAEAAEAGYKGSGHIRTFVIGVGDVAKFNLDNYARAGGTTKAFLTDAGDVTSSFVGALNNISNRKLACEYKIPAPPAGMKLDTKKVQVIYTPASGGPEEVPRITALSACADNANGGWYYDDPANPTKITVCPCSCARFQAGHVDVRLGCRPRLGIR
jgi:hypothetical protein